MQFYKVLILIIIILIIIKHIVLAKVSGPCSNCHTMHYSQSGTIEPYWGKEGPYQNLLINNCVGCHSAGNPSTWKDPITGAPIVYNTAEPTYGFYYTAGGKYEGLAGGNFYYVTQGDIYGHNVVDIPGVEKDSLNGQHPPGTLEGKNCGCCHTSNLLTPGILGYSGCEFCHNDKHHADDTGPVVNGTGGWYRFLNFHTFHSSTFQPMGFEGVEGIEDPNWECNPDSFTHNEYPGGGNYEHSISLFCAVCHGSFYEYEKSGSSWYHHPTDYAIPNSGEYADAFGANGTGIGTWDPMVPVARPYSNLESMTGPDQNVYIGIDMVQCLSCHRAHASPYPSILRWDYNACLNGQANSCGCFVCHTEKD